MPAIDHPLDPANKYFAYASVESAEMMNIYTGNVTTNAQGNATVHLPEWFEILKADVRYQLTMIGQFAQAIVAHEVQNHEFTIRTTAPHVKVSWQITYPLQVEVEKSERERTYANVGLLITKAQVSCQSISDSTSRYSQPRCDVQPCLSKQIRS